MNRDRNNTGTDYSQGTGGQPFVRQVNEERSGFDTGSRENRGGFGSQEQRRSERNDNENPIPNRDRS